MFWQWKTFEDHSFPYLNGNGFAVQCKYIWNYDGYKINPYKENNWVFVKTDYIEDFFLTVKINHPFVIFTSNSDFPINEKHIKYIEDPRVVVWFAENAAIRHPKLKTIPIGLAPAGYAHGDISIVNKIRSENNQKNNLFYVNFSIGNNPIERNYCLEQIQMPMSAGNKWDGYEGGYSVLDSFEGYLRNLSKSYFCISPKGNGIDCHRTWESLYMKTIPIVTRSLVAEEHSDMPIIILEDWSDFRKMEFSKELYYDTWKDFKVEDLHTDNYIKRISNLIP